MGFAQVQDMAHIIDGKQEVQHELEKEQKAKGTSNLRRYAQKVRHIGIRYLVEFITRFAMKPMNHARILGGLCVSSLCIQATRQPRLWA